MSAVRLLPLTVTLWEVPAVPWVVVPRLSELVLTVMVGVGTGLTAPLTVMSCSVAPVLSAAIMPLTGPTGAVAVIRANTVVVPTVPPDSAKSRVVL